MFSATKQPLPLSEACIQCLCASLNAPVVRLDGLPNGPARAAVVVYAEQYGDLGLAMAVRSLEVGAVVLLRARESLPPDTNPAKALDVVVSFGESLGFVFDVDMLATDGSLAGHREALEHWQRLVASDERFAARDVASPPAPSGSELGPDIEKLPEMEDLWSGAPGDGGEAADIELDELSLGEIGPDDLETGGDELLLDDIAALEIADGEIDAPAMAEIVAEDEIQTAEPIATEATRMGQDGAAFAASPLSKFRRPGEASEEDEGAGGGSALGRIRIVRVKKSKDGRAPARARILGSY